MFGESRKYKMSQKVEKVQKGRGQPTKSKSPQFKMWTFWQISNFSQIQKSSNCQGGGSRKLWTFSTFWEIFYLGLSPKLSYMTFAYILYAFLASITFTIVLSLETWSLGKRIDYISDKCGGLDHKSTAGQRSWNYELCRRERIYLASARETLEY